MFSYFHNLASIGCLCRRQIRRCADFSAILRQSKHLVPVSFSAATNQSITTLFLGSLHFRDLGQFICFRSVLGRDLIKKHIFRDNIDEFLGGV